ncbi:MAG: VTT domain-containing protein [Dehalococcoidales bacterium]|nr:VTT domain-containing protein [Dehalococcoidales bacterium]
MNEEYVVQRRWLTGAGAGLVLLLLGGFSAYVAGVQWERLTALGYPGIFLLMLLSGGSVVVPVPGPATVMAVGAVLNPLLVGIFAGLGNATGEVFSYTIGRVAATALVRYRNSRFILVLESWLKRNGFLVILIMAAIPNPVFHALSLLAGSVSYPVRRFWLACALGNILKYAVAAYLGSAAIGLLR